MNKAELTQRIKSQAEILGFYGCGIAKAERLDEEAEKLELWLSKGLQGGMHYMENHFEKRVDPRQLVPGAKSVISLMYNYFPEDDSPSNKTPKLARYAYGRDYHKVVKKKLKNFMQWINDEIGEIDGRCFVDSAPVMEREWAKRGGLGWLGKNTLLLSKQKGSYFFLAEIISDLELEYDHPIRDHCGTCTKCIDACPTDAISENGYILDASKCISYLTIELKTAIPEEFKDQMEGWMFGCDICQEVCPWNRFSTPHKEEDFLPSEDLINMEAWENISEEVFHTLFKGSPVKRTKYTGLKRNIDFITE